MAKKPAAKKPAKASKKPTPTPKKKPATRPARPEPAPAPDLDPDSVDAEFMDPDDDEDDVKPPQSLVVVDVPAERATVLYYGLVGEGLAAQMSVRDRLQLLEADVSDSYIRAGFVLALSESGIPSAELAPYLQPAEVLRGGLPPGDGPEWNGYFAGRYAATRDKAALAELVRRAMHRDGSTWSVVTGSAAHDLLERVAARGPDIAELLKAESGVDVGRLSFGDFPSAIAPGVRSDAPAVSLVAAAPAIAAPQLGALNVTVAGEQLSIDGARISVTAGIRLVEGLQAAIWKLFVPADGFSWIDHLEGTGGRLVCDDTYIAKAAKYPFKESDPSGHFVAAEVFQSDGRGNEPIGVFRAEVYGSSPNSSLFSNVSDYNEAKVRVANAVRLSIPKV